MDYFEISKDYSNVQSINVGDYVQVKYGAAPQYSKMSKAASPFYSALCEVIKKNGEALDLRIAEAYTYDGNCKVISMDGVNLIGKVFHNISVRKVTPRPNPY